MSNSDADLDQCRGERLGPLSVARALLDARLTTVSGAEREAVATILAEAVSQMDSDSSGHDAWHSIRVMNMNCHLGAMYGGDVFILAMAALLHDLGHQEMSDADDYARHHLASGMVARQLLNRVGVTAAKAEAVVSAIVEAETLADDQPACSTLEAKIQYDSDRLDAIGAVGVARAFMFGGRHGIPMHAPSLAARAAFDAAVPSATVINHFREKLLRLDRGYYTPEAERIACLRVRVTQEFLDQFLAEWQVRVTLAPAV